MTARLGTFFSLPALIILIGLAVPSWSSQVYFSSNENVERPIANAIEHTHNVIQAALFEINSPALISALQHAAGRGVHVQLLLQKGSKGSVPIPDADFLTHLDIRWLGGRSRTGLMHHKFAVFDGESVVTGSYNWTKGARHANYENALFENDADVVKAYAQQFELLWDRSRTIDSPVARRRHSARHHRSKATL